MFDVYTNFNSFRSRNSSISYKDFSIQQKLDDKKIHTASSPNDINGINFLSQIGHSAYSDLIALKLDVNTSTYLGYMKKMCNLLVS